LLINIRKNISETYISREVEKGATYDWTPGESAISYFQHDAGGDGVEMTI
jgi:hypothetical protein